MKTSRVVLALALTAACRAKSAEPTADAASAPSASAVVPEPDSAPPAASVPLADAPDVRVTLPPSPQSALSGVAKVGQTFGILIPHPNDFLDDWELDGKTSLGEPLTFIARYEIGQELLWKIADDAVGTHVVKLRLMHRATRESPRTPAKRVVVTVTVTPR